MFLEFVTSRHTRDRAVFKCRTDELMRMLKFAVKAVVLETVCAKAKKMSPALTWRESIANDLTCASSKAGLSLEASASIYFMTVSSFNLQRAPFRLTICFLYRLSAFLCPKSVSVFPNFSRSSETYSMIYRFPL